MTTAPAAHPLPRSITVIIPVRDGADTIAEQLEALSNQTYEGPFDVIVADNGSTDGTQAIARNWASRLPALTVLDASRRPNAAFARNLAAGAATAEFLAFCDADDVVTPTWLAALAAAARDFDIVTGPQDVTQLNAPAVQSWRPTRRRQLTRANRFLPFAPSCNVGVWASVFRETGGFNEDYPSAEDVEWSWRAVLASFTIGFADDAVVHYRYRSSAWTAARQGYNSAIGWARLQRDYGSRGLERPPFTRSVRAWLWLVARSPYLTSRARRGIWMRRAGEAVGRVSGTLRNGPRVA
jgi:glycosyltransferase involved in cell wall biosynthesis